MSNAERRETRRLVANLLVITGRQPEDLELCKEEQQLARKLFDGENASRKSHGEDPIVIGGNRQDAGAAFPSVGQWIVTADITRLAADFLKERFGGKSLLSLVTCSESELKGLHPASKKKIEAALRAWGLHLGMSEAEAQEAYAEWLDSHAADNGVARRAAVSASL